MKLSFLTPVIFKLLLSDASAQCVTSGFRLKDLDECTFEALLVAFTPIFNDPINRNSACSSSSAEQDLITLLGSTSKNAAKSKLQEVCAQGIADYSETVSFAKIPGYGESFIENFFNGGTSWNTLHETSYPLDKNGETTNVLKQEASQVKSFYEGQGQYGLVEWPDQLPNFSDCQINAAYCCWSSDRQADDNNGNCATPYDENCVDADPADNTDLCFVDVSAGSGAFGKSDDGTFFFPHDDNNNRDHIKAEGPIHCHGIGWADDQLDPSATYKGNNLFYVSMYDHMYKRGYVRNVPGAPMCGCAEQMPIVSRSDCTQMDVIQQFEITFDGGAFEAFLTKIEIDFNSCEGLDRYGMDDSNDLWSHMNRLYIENKITADTLMALNTKLVGDDDNMCQFAMNKHMAKKGFAVGHQSGWTQLAGREALDMESPLGRSAFKLLFDASPSKILQRICPYCYVSHRNIFYKRLTPLPQDFDLLGALKYSNEPMVGNIWGVDFDMYSTYDDAVEGVNAWMCPNGVYKDESGFPGDCSPTGDERKYQHSLYNHGYWGGQMDTAWFADASSPFTTLSSTVIGVPPEWFRPDITASVTEADGKLYMTSNAVEMWGAADNIQFYSEEHPGDVEVIVRLDEFQYLSGWAKTGIVIRESDTAPGAKYFSVLVSGDNGVYSQWRETTDDDTHSNTQKWDGSEPFSSPIWLRALKQGNLFTGYQSTDGINWNMRTSVEIPMSGSVHAGLALAANHWSDDVAEAIFANYEKRDYYWPSSAPSLSPAPTTYNIPGAKTIGNMNSNLPGQISYAANSNKYVAKGAGGIGGNSDNFYFAPVSKTGDFTVTSFITDFVSPASYSKSALMIRDPGTDPGAVQVSCVLQNEHGVYMYARTETGGGTDFHDVNWHDAQTSGWCKLEKAGNTVTGYRSFDGMNWDEMESITAAFTSTTVDVGVLATGTWAEHGTATFENFEFS